MIAEWMIYCALLSAAVSFAAIVVERGLLAGRAPVRMVWVFAIVVSTVAPVGVLVLAPRTVVADAPRSAIDFDQTLANVPTPVIAGTPSIETPSRTTHVSARNWRVTLEKISAPLAYLWAALSFVLACNFVGGVATLAWMRRKWESRTVLGVPVLVSEQSGPAVVGVFTPAIVLPKWVFTLDASQLALMLKHEEEHRRAGDGQIVTLARLALIAMPWNVALWYQMQRLRVAVELDCDARVLRDADARTYGDLLLNVARRPSGTSLSGATAFAERATQLEKRIEHLPRHRHQTTRRAAVVAVAAALTVVTAACIAPHPAVLQLSPVRSSTTTIVPQLDSTKRVNQSKDLSVDADRTTSKPMSRESSIPTLAERGRAAKRELPKQTTTAVPMQPPTASMQIPAKRDSEPGFLRMERKHDGRVETQVIQTPGLSSITEQSDSIFKFLFADVRLTPEQAAQARELLKQIDLRESLALSVGRATAALRERQARVLKRDSLLRTLLTNDTDITLFDAHASASSQPGGRGRSGGANPDTSAASQRVPPGGGGRSGGGGGGRGGGAGISNVDAMNTSSGGARGGRGSMPQTIEAAAENVYRRLFDGMTLTSQQQQRARDEILAAQRDLAAITTPAVAWRAPGSQLPALVHIDATSAYVLVRAPTDTAIVDLFSNVVDRAKVRARLATVRQ